MRFIHVLLLNAVLVAAGIFIYDSLKEADAAPGEFEDESGRIERLEQELEEMRQKQATSLATDRSPAGINLKLAHLQQEVAQIVSDKARWIRAMEASGKKPVLPPAGAPTDKELVITKFLASDEALNPEAVRVIKRLIAQVKREAALAEELRRYDAMINQARVKVEEADRPLLVSKAKELRREMNKQRERFIEEKPGMEKIQEAKQKLADQYRREFRRFLNDEDAETFVRRFIPAPPTPAANLPAEPVR